MVSKWTYANTDMHLLATNERIKVTSLYLPTIENCDRNEERRYWLAGT